MTNQDIEAMIALLTERLADAGRCYEIGLEEIRMHREAYSELLALRALICGADIVRDA